MLDHLIMCLKLQLSYAGLITFATGAMVTTLISAFWSVHEEYREDNITITSLQHGPTETDFFDRAGMYNSKIYDSDKDDPTTVAEKSYKALMDGKDHILAGSTMNSVQAFTSKFISDKQKAKLQKQQIEPKNH